MGVTVGGAHPVENITVWKLLWAEWLIPRHILHHSQAPLTKRDCSYKKMWSGVSGQLKLIHRLYDALSSASLEDFSEWERVWVMVGGRHYTCTTEMNGALIVEYFVAQFSQATFIQRSLSVYAVPYKYFNTFIYAHIITQLPAHKWLTSICWSLPCFVVVLRT